MSELIAKVQSQIFQFFESQTQIFQDNLSLLQLSTYQIVIDIIIIAILFYMVMSWVQGSRAVQILSGLVFLGFLYAFSVALELIAVKALFNIFFPALIIALPVVFQQELRRGLEQLGQRGWFARSKRNRHAELRNKIVTAVKNIKTKKKGALIVIEKDVRLKDYIDTGVELNATVSAELILSIFLSKGPLHDGAIIIRGETVVAAGCVLPFTEQIKKIEFGTRHKSAIGLSEITDALVITVSEEKREIAVAHHGELHQKLTPEKLNQHLTSFYRRKNA